MTPAPCSFEGMYRVNFLFGYALESLKWHIILLTDEQSCKPLDR